MRPSKCLRDVGRAFAGQSDSRLIVPEGMAHMALTVDGFIHHVPREHLAPIVADNHLNVIFHDVSQLVRREMSVGQPLRVVLPPQQIVPSDLHAVCLGKSDNAVACSKSKTPREGSVALHFISFSASTMLNCLASVAA